MTQKQMKAMQSQGYMITKCPDCWFYKSEKDSLGSEKNKRCSLGCFPVKKSGTCREHTDMETAKAKNYHKPARV